MTNCEQETAFTSAPSAVPVTVIQPRKGWAWMDWGEIWRYRDLLYFLAWRDVKVRYKQTALGAAWAILQPLAGMAVFTLFFGRLAGLDRQTGGVPYSIFVYTGLLLWTFFANAVTNSANGFIENERLVTKVYFPRLLIPAASIGVGLVDLAIACLVLLPMMWGYGVGPGAAVLALPILLALATAAALGVGLFLCALNVQYRDFRYVIPFLVQLWLFATPVVYPASIVPPGWHPLLGVNPMAGLVEGFRAALLGGAMPWGMAAVSAVVSVLLFLFGMAWFHRFERTFADVI